MKLYFKNDVIEYVGDPETIFKQLVKKSKKDENIEFNLLNYCDILHTLCYKHSMVKFSHIDQVYMNLLTLNKAYANSKYTVDILKLTAVYHDIAKTYDNPNHGKIASDLIVEDIIVSKFLDSETILEVSNAILKHSYNVVKKKDRKGKLSKILYDADAIRCVTEFKPSDGIGYFIEYIESMYYKFSKDIMVDMFSLLNKEDKKKW